MVMTVTHFSLTKQLEVHECVTSGGIPMKAPVLCGRWDPNKSLEASASLRSNKGLHAKRAWNGVAHAPVLYCLHLRPAPPSVRSVRFVALSLEIM